MTLMLAGFGSSAGAQDFLPGNEAALTELNRHFGTAVYPFARRGAQPLGITGFELYGEISLDQDLDDESYGELVADLPGGQLLPVRVGVRKGLLGGFDVGASYTKVLDLDYEALAFDVQKAIFKPTALRPGLGLRIAYSDGDSGEVYSLKQYGAELIASKGFTIVSIFGGAGVVRSEGDFRFVTRGQVQATEFALSTSATETVLFAGVRVNLLLPKLTFVVEKTDQLQGVFRIAVGW